MKDLKLYQPCRRTDHVAVAKKDLQRLIKAKKDLDRIKETAMIGILAIWLMVLGFVIGLWIMHLIG